MPARPTCKLAALALLLAVSAAGGAAAQGEAAGPAPEAAQPAPPAAQPSGIALAQLTVRSEETRQQLKELTTSLAVPESVTGIEQALDERVAETRKARRDSLDRLAKGGAGDKALSDMEREWQLRQNDLKAWNDELTRYGSTIDAVIAKLDELSKPWKVTRERVTGTEAASVRKRVDAVLGDVSAVEKVAQERLSHLLALQSRVAVLNDLVGEVLVAVRAAQSNALALAFEPNAPPLWQVAASEDVGMSWRQVVQEQRDEMASLHSYLVERHGRLVAHLTFVLATLLVSLYLGRRVRRWSQDEPQLAETARVLRDPISVAVLVGVATTRLFYPLPPRGLAEVMGLLLLVPALTLLPRLVDIALRPIVFALALLYLVSQVRNTVDATPLLYRFLQVLQLAGGIGFLVWLVGPSRREGPRRLSAGATALARGLIAVLGVLLVAAVLGYTTIASVVGQGILVSAYAAALLYAVYRVAAALISALLHTELARRLRIVRIGEERILSWSSRLLRVGGLIWWLEISLRSFGAEQRTLALLEAVVTTDLAIGSVAISLGDVLLFGGVLTAAYYLSRFVRFVLEEDVFPRVVLHRGVSNAISTALNYTILFAGFLFAVAAAGMDLSRLTLLAGAFGVGIGFGLQNVVNNFVSGLILLFERPIQVGDTIEVVGGLLGEVRRIGPRSSTVRTFDGAEVIVPNGMLISDQVINWTLSDRRRRVTVSVGVKYGTDPERVLELLREVARENETVMDDPAPLAIFSGFGDSSLDFELRCWIPRYEEGFGMRTELLTAIARKLGQAGIEIPFPQRDLHLRSVEASAAAALAERGGEAAGARAGIRLIPDDGRGSGR